MSNPSAIYCRFSERPNGKECESNELQKERCTAFAAAHGYTVLDVFEDRELSGKNTARPGFQKALKFAKQHKATLICYSLSRLSRNVRDTLAIADELHDSGAGLALLDINMDTTTSTGRCVLTILAAVAELERTQISERTSHAMKRKQAMGVAMGRIAPIGYKIENQKLIEVPEEQDAIKRILELHRQNHTQREIAALMGETCRGHAWKQTTISAVIRRHAS